MKVLVSEDNDYKYSKIAAFFELNNCLVVRKTCVEDTVVELTNDIYDVLVQDMQLPQFSDSRDINTQGGADCLEEAFFRELLPEHVFICSSGEIYENEDILARYDIDFPITITKFEVGKTGWKNPIKKRLGFI